MVHVLVIDDDRSVLEMVEILLLRRGHGVTTLPDGVRALEHCRSNDVDLVLTDIHMPEQEGIETIIALRREFPGLPVVAMSGGGLMGNEECLRLARACGAAATLHKPFGPEDLDAAIATAVGEAS